jgi:hypothetical protein
MPLDGRSEVCSVGERQYGSAVMHSLVARRSLTTRLVAAMLDSVQKDFERQGSLRFAGVGAAFGRVADYLHLDVPDDYTPSGDLCLIQQIGYL